MNAILMRHASAWMNDRWYRRAWFATPFATTLLVGLMLAVQIVRPSAPPMPAGWVHPSNDQVLGKVLATLRDQAKTDAGALKLLAKRAEAGQAMAQFYMATLFDPTLDRAHATAERTNEALGWYRKAADGRNMSAAANLGNLLAYDRPGHPADYAEAFRWLEMAAPVVPMAQRELGQLYRFGRGVPPDAVKGVDLLRTAAEHNDVAAAVMLAEAYDRGSDGLAQDRHEAVLLWQKAALANVTLAQRELAIHLLHGQGVPVDKDRAMVWFRRAAEHGDVYAKAQLAGPAANPGGSAGYTQALPTMASPGFSSFRP